MATIVQTVSSSALPSEKQTICLKVSTHCTEGDNSSDSQADTVSVLPKHTRVLVTGNNRTKRLLVGQEAVVKKAVGLGGWHWLVSM